MQSLESFAQDPRTAALRPLMFPICKQLLLNMTWFHSTPRCFLLSLSLKFPGIKLKASLNNPKLLRQVRDLIESQPQILQQSVL